MPSGELTARPDSDSFVRVERIRAHAPVLSALLLKNWGAKPQLIKPLINAQKHTTSKSRN